MGAKKILLVLAGVILTGLPVWSQKVKYKDLILLLNNNQFDQAEPHLRRYLRENDDTPSAYLYMGIILQNKAYAVDMLKDTDQATAYMDSATFFLKKALEGITERDVDRNEEYYQRFRSRDLRTGEFEIKFSEVRFRLEQDVKSLSARRENIGKLRIQFEAFRSVYEDSKRKFQSLILANPSEKEFYLRATEASVAALAEIKGHFDSAMWHFESYLAITQQIGKTGYRHLLDKKDVVKYGEDGKRDFNFYHDDLKVWNYGAWADRSARFIQEKVFPLREELLATDRDLGKLRQVIEKDSVSVLKQLDELYPRLKVNPIEQYDENPMPLKVFRMTHAELCYYSKWLENKLARQENDLLKKKSAFQSELPYLRRLDSLSGSLLVLDIESEATNYQSYVKTTYGSTGVLKNLISSTHEFARREVDRCERALAAVSRSLNWLVIASDSIPLVLPVSASKPIQPLVVKEEKFTHGIKYGVSGPAMGYFFTITPSRVPEIQIVYALDSAFSNRKNLSFFKGLSASDEQGQVYFTAVFSERRDALGKFPVTICKLYRTDGLAWQANYQFDTIPSDMQFNAGTGELLVSITVAGESKKMVIDKTGKLIR